MVNFLSNQLITPPLGLYVHIPWCVRKCPYCDFNSHAVGDQMPEFRYVDAVLADLEQDLVDVSGRCLQSIFIGGGTPSLFSVEALNRLLLGIRKRIACDPALEITLEANPATFDGLKFNEFKQIGINRLSIGIQSFSDQQLRALGRVHNGQEAFSAVEVAHAADFKNINLDLMFGLPGQEQHHALKDIQTAIDLEPNHISHYQLTIEPNTLFHSQPPQLPSDEFIWGMQQDCQLKLSEYGYQQYEISAYAQADFQCRHNQNYWRFGDYLGVGAGAHGKITDPDKQRIIRVWKLKNPKCFMDAAYSSKRIGAKTQVPRLEIPFEYLMNHLRLKEGFDVSKYHLRTGLPITSLEPALSDCLDEGLLKRESDNISCTPFGWNFLDTILERFLPHSATHYSLQQ